MDIDLLAKMVKEIILDNDAVTLPGIGSFTAELIPSSFTDRGYAITPPYRKLGFTEKEGGDSLLTDFYAASNSVEKNEAAVIVREFLAEMKDLLKERKTMLLPGLGKLRATRENIFFFVPDEELDIYPAGFGLEPVSLKSHAETDEEASPTVTYLSNLPAAETASAEAETAVEIADEFVDIAEDSEVEAVGDSGAVETVEETAATEADEEIETDEEAEKAEEAEEAEIETAEEAEGTEEAEEDDSDDDELVGAIEDAEDESDESDEDTEAADDAVVETVAAVSAEADDDAGHDAAWLADDFVPYEYVGTGQDIGKIILKIAFIIVVTVLVLVIAYLVFANIAPDTLDRLLYTPEELEIIRKAGW